MNLASIFLFVLSGTSFLRWVLPVLLMGLLLTACPSAPRSKKSAIAGRLAQPEKLIKAAEASLEAGDAQACLKSIAKATAISKKSKASGSSPYRRRSLLIRDKIIVLKNAAEAQKKTQVAAKDGKGLMYAGKNDGEKVIGEESDKPKTPFAEGFKNSGFENGNADGWIIDAQGHRILSPSELRSFRKGKKGWEQIPFQYNFLGPKNKYFLYVYGDKPSTVSTESTERIQAGKKYTVAISCVTRCHKPSRYTLSVFYLDSDGAKHRIGLDTGVEREGTLFERSVTFVAQKGMPFIGKRIALTLYCSKKRFWVDNANIKVEPIPKNTSLEKAVRSLPLVNVLDKQGNPNVTTCTYKDFKYSQPIEQKGSFENTGLPFPGYAQLNSIDSPDYTFHNFKQDLTLSDGESASVLVSTRGVNFYAGLALGKNIFVLGQDRYGLNPFITPDYMAYIAKVSDGKFRKELILISRSGNRIDWFSCGRKGSYEIPGSSISYKLNLFTRGQAGICQLRKGTLSSGSKAMLSSFDLAPQSPFGRPNLPFADYWGVDYIPMNSLLSTDLNTPLSKEEIASMKDLVSSFPAFGIGVGADSLSALPGMYVPLKVFLITRSKKVLDDMLRVSDRAILSRNGFTVNGVQYGVISKRNADGTVNTRHKNYQLIPVSNGHTSKYINTFDSPKVMMRSEEDAERHYFNKKHEYVSKYVITSSQRGNTRGILPALTAYCISLHPELWDKQTPSDSMNLGATYGERARRYVKDLALHYSDFGDLQLHWYKVNPIYKTFAEERTHCLPNSTTELPTHAINRFSSSMSAAGFAANAAEAFGDTKSMKAIDSCAEKFIKTWFNNFHFYSPGHDKLYLDQPENWYRTFTYTAHDTNQEDHTYNTDTPPGQGFPRSEDRGHLNFTLNGFQLLYDSHRYEDIMTPKAMTEVARTINEMVKPTYDTWRPLPRGRGHKDYDINKGFSYQYSAMLMFGDFNAELKEKLVKCLAEDVKADHNKRAINLVNLALMRARKFNQIPKQIVE